MALSRDYVRQALSDGREIAFTANASIDDRIVEIVRFIIPVRKILCWALVEENRAKVFWNEWQIDGRNPEELVLLIEEVALHARLVRRRHDRWGQRYEQTMLVRGPNGKEAWLLVGWIDDGHIMRMTTVHIDGRRGRHAG